MHSPSAGEYFIVYISVFYAHINEQLNGQGINVWRTITFPGKTIFNTY